MKPLRSGMPSPAVLAGIVSFVLAGALGSIRPAWATAPLAVFVGLCAAASFFPTSGFFLPVISRGSPGKHQVALTFDDGPDPATTPPLLDLLDRYGVKAAFFVTGVRVSEYGDLVRKILGRGHAVGNHSWHHSPLLMLHSFATIAGEIRMVQELLRPFGIEPLVFRPPVGVTNPKLAVILPQAGLKIVNFSCRGNDFGNRRVAGLARRVLAKVKPGDIVMLHDVRPVGHPVEAWLQEIEAVLIGLMQKGLAVVPLEELIGEPVMRKIGS